MDGLLLEHVSEFKCLKWVLYESGADEAERRRKVTSGRRVAGTNRSLQFECARVLHESLLVVIVW